MLEKIKLYKEKIENTWFGWWIKNYKVSFLLIALLIGYGTFSLIRIPKESTPDIPFGIVQIATAYPGANPVDIDSIITQKIEDEIKDMPEVDALDSTSSLGISSVVITLNSNADTKDFINEVKTKIDNLIFPEDVTDPRVMEISTDNAVLFQMMLYGPRNQFTLNQVRSLAMRFKDEIKGKVGIVDVTIA